MVFVPLMGAFVTTNRAAKNLAEDAFIGIMGPVFGAGSSLICLLIGLATGNPFWFVLSSFGFLINLFNMIPMAPLDGGWIAPVFSPKLLAVGVVLMVALAILMPIHNPMIYLLALLSLPRIIGGWRADPKTEPYYQVTARDRAILGASYLLLAAFLALGQIAAHDLAYAAGQGAW